MDIEAAFTAYLLTQTGLTALIDRRIFPDETPQYVDLSKQTAVAYTHISDEKINTHEGINKTERPNYQFTAYAPPRAEAKTISTQIKAALCDYTGTMGGLTIQYVVLINEIYSTEHPAEGASVSMCDLEFEINYERG